MLSTIVLSLIYGGLIAWLTMGPLLITNKKSLILHIFTIQNIINDHIQS